MKKPPRPRVAVEKQIDELLRFPDELRRQAEIISSALGEAKAEGFTSLLVKNQSTAEDGVANIASYIGAIFTAIAKRKLERALGSGSKKMEDSLGAAKKLSEGGQPQGTATQSSKRKPTA